MNLSLIDIGKEYNYHWIFRHLDIELTPGRIYGIGGPNGSGKSTLLQIMSGFLSPSEGSILFRSDEKDIDPDEFYRFLSLAAPYTDIPEELTLDEFIHFHFRFKKALYDRSPEEVIILSGLDSARRKMIKYFSSGMKQRTKLLSAIMSDSEVLLLDEPSTNLDLQGIQWFQALLKEHMTMDRLVVIASNEQGDLALADEIFDVKNYF